MRQSQVSLRPRLSLALCLSSLDLRPPRGIKKDSRCKLEHTAHSRLINYNRKRIKVTSLWILSFQTPFFSFQLY